MRSLFLALAVIVAMPAVPAWAQPYGGGWRYYEEDVFAARPRRDRYDPGEPDIDPPRRFYDRRRPVYGYSRPQRFGRMCVTARGNCPTRPGPLNTSCGCYIPGFGPKRGAIGF